MAIVSPTPAEEFVALLRDPGVKAPDVTRFLDALEPGARIEAVRAAGRREQQALWRLVKGYASVRLVDLVPPRVPALATVRHFGRNTLPAFTHFEKRFTRPSGEDPDAPRELHGFNFQKLAPITGPGYFVAVEAPERTEVWIDYRRVPDQHPEGWPEIRPNDRGLSRFVYGFMVDTLRRVSEHVTIGSAARNGKDLGSWFVLTREPEPVG